MKKFYYLVASMAFILVVIMACEKSAIGVDETLTVKDEVLSAKGDKSQVIVDILHWDGEKFILISVAGASVESHMAHGDKYPCVPYVQGFEVDASGWLDINSEWYGLVTKVPSGNEGINSSDGGYHAIFAGDDDSGPFTRFDGYKSTWTGTWTAVVDIYLDPSWDTSQGFDYSVAASGSNGAHRRDYIFHVNKDDSSGELLVAGSNNTNFAPREDLETLNHYQVTTAGWYTFQHVFSEVGGQLSVDLNLLDSDGTNLFTETRTSENDTIDLIGGNRYGWFTFINVESGINVDNVILNRCN